MSREDHIHWRHGSFSKGSIARSPIGGHSFFFFAGGVSTQVDSDGSQIFPVGQLCEVGVGLATLKCVNVSE